MDTNATLRAGRTPWGAAAILVLGLVAAFLLGGTGGYLVRGLSSAPAVATNNGNLHVNGSPTPAGTPEPFRYPRAK